MDRLVEFLAACCTDIGAYEYRAHKRITDEVIGYNVRSFLFNAMTWAGIAFAIIALKHRSLKLLSGAVALLAGRISVDSEVPETWELIPKNTRAVTLFENVVWKYPSVCPDGYATRWTGRGWVVGPSSREGFIPKK